MALKRWPQRADGSWAFRHGRLLTSASPKTIKTLKRGYLTWIQYLSPVKSAGRQNVCPFASAGCSRACLNFSGKGPLTSSVQARHRRTQLYFDDRAGYFELLATEIEWAIGYTLTFSMKPRGGGPIALVPVFRLNGLSDIVWEDQRFHWRGSTANVMEHFPGVQFYDYTKIPHRFERALPPNYYLIYSLSEEPRNQAYAKRLLFEKRANVAAVFLPKSRSPYAIGTLPATLWGFPVFDADEHDLRFLDPGPGQVAGLHFKLVLKDPVTNLRITGDESVTRAALAGFIQRGENPRAHVIDPLVANYTMSQVALDADEGVFYG